MRVVLPASRGPVDGVVILEGHSAGAFISMQDVGLTPALDVSGVVDIVIKDPAIVSSLQVGAKDAGFVFEGEDESGLRFVGLAVSIPQSGALRGYLRLDGPKRGHIEPMASRTARLGHIDVIEHV